jgi:hypothetical protein
MLGRWLVLILVSAVVILAAIGCGAGPTSPQVRPKPERFPDPNKAPPRS